MSHFEEVTFFDGKDLTETCTQRGRSGHLVFFLRAVQRQTKAMLRKELLDARKALRGVREGVSGPRSKKQRGEWELVSIQNMYYSSIKWVVGAPSA